MFRKLARGLNVVAVITVAATCASCASLSPTNNTAQETRMHQDFETAAIGTLPANWVPGHTGVGGVGVWKIATDSSAPKGGKVLSKTGDSPKPIYDLCVAQDVTLADVEVSVAFKAVGGKLDQGAGLMWRYQDENNYYVARYNPLEENYRLYRVVDGKRTKIDGKEELKVSVGQWHTLTVRMQGDTITCILDGTPHVTGKDASIIKPGQTGLWTKADAQTLFDDFRVSPF